MYPEINVYPILHFSMVSEVFSYILRLMLSPLNTSSKPHPLNTCWGRVRPKGFHMIRLENSYLTNQSKRLQLDRGLMGKKP